MIESSNITSKNNNDILGANILIHGLSGAGKSYSTTFLDNKKTLVLDAENGLKCLNGLSFDKWNLFKKETAKEKLNSFVEFIKFVRLPETKAKYNTLVIDSLTEIGEIILKTLEQDPEFADKTKVLPRYGELGKVSIQLIKALRDIEGYNKIYLALSDYDKDQEGNVYKGISYPGKSSQKIPAYMDIVLYLTSQEDKDGNIKRFFLSEQTGKVMAKDRTQKLNKKEYGSLDEILKKISSKTK